MAPTSKETADLDVGDLVVALLGETLVELRDRLWDDGFHRAADAIADLVARCDLYMEKEAANGN